MLRPLLRPKSRLIDEVPAGMQSVDTPPNGGHAAAVCTDGRLSRSAARSMVAASRSTQAREAPMLGWFQALMPKEERFFDLFTRHAQLVVAGAEELHRLLHDGDRVEHYCRQISERETEADEITRQVLTAVRRTFITPFDRSDIQDLITSMDDAIDQMNKTAKSITLFEVRSFEPQMQQMGDVILEAAKLVLEAVPLLSNIGKNAGRLNQLTEKIIRIEEHADHLHDQGRKALFVASRRSADGNAMRYIIGNDIYDHLERVVDRFEDVANEISALVVDHL